MIMETKKVKNAFVLLMKLKQNQKDDKSITGMQLVMNELIGHIFVC